MINANTQTRKKLAKVALLSATLTLGITLGQSLFNEAQASGSLTGGCLSKSNKGNYCCACGGSDCGAACC